jgi:ligand-binding sensor domain-containing protein
VNSIYEDSENLWITTDKGVDLSRYPRGQLLLHRGLRGGSEVSAVLPRNDNSLWVGLRGIQPSFVQTLFR